MLFFLSHSACLLGYFFCVEGIIPDWAFMIIPAVLVALDGRDI